MIMKKKRILWGLLILCCILFVRPTESKADDDVYTINISKTSPAAAEKKLRKMKASSTQKLRLTVDITNEKGYKYEVEKVEIMEGLVVDVYDTEIMKFNSDIARKKMLQWLEKFQKLKANTYGVLPIHLSSNSNVSMLSPGTYIYGSRCYVSDYVNINTIFDKAYDATEGKCEYLGNYFDKIVEREQFSYLDTYNGGKRIKIDTTNGIINITEMLKDVPVKQYTKAELKKQSDSVRVQVLLYGVSKAQLFTINYDATKKTKDSLYDLARGTGVICPNEPNEAFSRGKAYELWGHLMSHLSNDIYIYWFDGATLGGHTFGTLKVKNSSDKWDYFEFYDTTIRPENTTSGTFSYLNDHPSARKEGSGKDIYNWITKGKATEADSFFLKKALKLLGDGTYVDYLMEHCGYCPNDKPIKLKLVNQNKTKYGFTSASYTLNVYEDENQQTAWDWVLNK